MLVDEEDIGPSRLLKRTVSCFGKAKLFYLLTLIRECHSVQYKNQSDNWRPGLVCVVIAV